MNNRKIIDQKKFNWADKEVSRLSYGMIFNERPVADEEPEEEVQIDTEALLRENDRKWERRLKKAKEEAFEYGFEQGRREGVNETRKEIDTRVASLKEGVQTAHEQWKAHQQLIEPGILDLVFELTEKVLDIPVENPAIRETMKSELGELLQKLDDSTKPVLWVSREDLEFVEELREEFSPELSVHIRTDDSCNPGEYRLETSRETVVQDFREILSDFKDSLSLPSWT